MRAAIDAVFNAQSMAKIAAVIQGKAMNGDLQAARMMWDYYGITKAEPEHQDEPERKQQGNVVQVNIETEHTPRAVRVIGAKTTQAESEGR
jgi:hypothetical protein